MGYRAMILLTALAAAWLLAGCTVAENTAPEDPADPGAGLSEDYWATTAIVDWGYVDLTEPKTQAEFAQADLIVLETAYFWQDGLNEGALDAIRALNPDVRIVGYVNAHDSWLSWDISARTASAAGRYTQDWFDATRPYWSHTTTGDTMFSWPGKVLLDVLDPACRQAMVDVLAAHWTAHSNVLDGIFWDHFNSYLWVPTVIPGVEGAMDLDGDGIPHREDEDEMQAYREASADLVLRVRRALGGDVIQIANGARATTDSTFATLLDGMFYEHFPLYHWGQAGMSGAVDLDRTNNLFAARSWPRTINGGPWLLLSNTSRYSVLDEDSQLVIWRAAEFNRAVGLLTGCLPVYYPEGTQYRYDWPEIDVDLGVPTGPAVFDGATVAREFARGRVVIDFAGAVGQIPFDFAIVQRDSIRQRFEMEDLEP